MKTKIYEAWKRHIDLYKSKTEHVQLEAFRERIESWMSIEEAIYKKKDWRWMKYKPFLFVADNDLVFVKEVIQRMQMDWNTMTTRYERERLWLIKAKHWLRENTSLLKLLSYLKNGNNTLSKSL